GVLYLGTIWIGDRIRVAKGLTHKKKRPATAVMTGISIAGVSVGVWALTVVLSVMSGFEADLKRKILGTNAHSWLMKYSDTFTEWKETMKTVEGLPGVVGATPFIMREVMISQRDALSGAELKGIDAATIARVVELPRQV